MQVTFCPVYGGPICCECARVLLLRHVVSDFQFFVLDLCSLHPCGERFLSFHEKCKVLSARSGQVSLVEVRLGEPLDDSDGPGPHRVVFTLEVGILWK